MSRQWLKGCFPTYAEIYLLLAISYASQIMRSKNPAMFGDADFPGKYGFKTARFAHYKRETLQPPDS